MKANELSCKNLMIGDWVFYSKKAFPYQIKLIGENLCKLDGIDNSVEIDEIHPVLLTEETLKKNGFDQRFHTSCQQQYISYSLSNNKGERIVIVNFKEGKLFSLEVYGFLIDVESYSTNSVHQLQHVLRLCNIEKEIEL